MKIKVGDTIVLTPGLKKYMEKEKYNGLSPGWGDSMDIVMGPRLKGTVVNIERTHFGGPLIDIASVEFEVSDVFKAIYHVPVSFFEDGYSVE